MDCFHRSFLSVDSINASVQNQYSYASTGRYAGEKSSLERTEPADSRYRLHLWSEWLRPHSDGERKSETCRSS